MSPELAFQTLIFGTINTALPSIESGAHPPADRPLPYIQFGQASSSDEVDGREITMEVHYWSNAEGPHEVSEYSNTIRDLLHGTVNTGNGYHFNAIRETFATQLLDVNENCWHRVQEFRAFVRLIQVIND